MIAIASTRKWNRAVRYAVAPAAVAVALGCRMALNPILQEASPFMYFIVAVLVSGWLGGLGPGLLATALTVLVVDYFYLPPIGGVLNGGLKENVQAISALILGAMISLIVTRLRRERGRFEQATEDARASETEARQGEAALRESEARFRGTFENAAIGMTHIDLNGNWLRVNPKFCEMLGYTREELESKKYWDLMHSEDIERDVASYAQLIRGNIDHYDLEKRYITRDGREIWAHVSRALQRDGEGKPLYSINNVVDITERKIAEQRLSEQNRFLKDILESLDHPFYVINANDYTIKLANSAAGLDIGPRTTCHSLTHGTDLPCHMRGHPCPIEKVKATGKPCTVEHVHHDREGNPRFYEIHAYPVFNSFGELTQIIEYNLDITERKRTEEELCDNEARLRAIFDNAGVGIFEVEAGDRFVAANDRTSEILGYRREELLALSVHELTDPEDRSLSDELNTRLHDGRTRRINYEKRFRRKGGTPVWVHVTVSAISDASGQWLRSIATVEDISERKRAEEALRQSEAQFRQLAEALPQMVWINRPDGYHEYINQLWYDFTGATPEESLGEMWSRLLHPDDYQRTLEYWHRCLQTGEPYEIEYRFRRADGQYRWFLGRALPVRDEQGAIIRWFGSCTEIHEQKIAQEELREADRRKDEFLAMLAHELRNPLAPIRYAVQMLNMTGPAAEHLQKQRDVIDRQVSHMGRLLDDLLEVSRITRGKITLKREIVDLRTVATQALDSMRPMIEGRGQELLHEAPSSPLPVDGDPTRLEQIIRNLLHNANKYTEAGGCIKISLGLETGNGSGAVVRISDSGIGITPEMLPHVFELFSQAAQTLDRPQGGLGIGLAMVKNLVQMHDGSVEAHSAGLGHGSEFVVHLPLATEVMGRFMEVSTPAEPSPAAPSKPRRVLVVDDNEDSAASLGELLSLWGHEIQTAHDGRHALVAARKWQPEIILLDIGLPGMDGYEVAQRLREDPATSSAFLVALTGYGQEEDRRRAQEAGFNQHLTKPVELGRLQNLLQEAQAA